MLMKADVLVTIQQHHRRLSLSPPGKNARNYHNAQTRRQRLIICHQG
jgi:hypothetical protein